MKMFTATKTTKQESLISMFRGNILVRQSLVFATLAIALLSGCASGPHYREANKSGALDPHSGNGMVLIYWLPGFVGSANPGTSLLVNNTPLPRLVPRGGFYSYEAAPGPLHIAFPGLEYNPTAGDNARAFATGGLVGVAMENSAHIKGFSVDTSVVPNQTNYIQLGFGKLKEVSKEQGEREVQKCRWINAPKQ
ncbi:MAG TPA: hypothetical protein VGM54_14135 [Chthoniobacter sp.]|jgi:hypothetical protein